MALPDVVLVTGASRGIGAAIARRAASLGSRVLVAARSTERCEDLAREIETAGGHAQALELDVADPRSIERAVAAAVDRVGFVGGLVNNAGIAISAPLLARGEELYEKHLAVNFHGPRRLVEALLPAMKQRGAGRIVNVASSAGLRGYRYVSAYCASKHALLGYTRAAAAELEGSGISIAAVCPHYVDTPMTHETVLRMKEKTGKSDAELRAFLASQNPAGRLITVEEVAAAALDLLGDGRNAWVVELDGGAARVIEGR